MPTEPLAYSDTLAGYLGVTQIVKFRLYFQVLIMVPFTGAILARLLKSTWDMFLYSILTLRKADRAAL